MQLRCAVPHAVFLVVAATIPAFSLGIGDKIQIHGFVSQGYLRTTQNNYLISTSTEGSFEFNDAALTVSVNPVDKLRLGLQLYSRDMGTEGNHAVVLDWAYGDYRLRDAIGVRLGRFKTPMQLYNQVRDIDMVRTSILLPQGIYAEDIRENSLATDGIDLYGNLGLGPLGDADYDVFVGGINIGTRDSRYSAEKNRASAGGMAVGMRQSPTFASVAYEKTIDYEGGFNYTGGGRLAWNLPFGLVVGGSGVMRKLWERKKTCFNVVERAFDSTTVAGRQREIIIPNRTDIIMVSAGGFAELTLNELRLSVEVDFPTLFIDGMAYLDDMHTYYGAPEGMTMGVKDTITGLSFYGMGSYRFGDHLSLGAYYSGRFNNLSDLSGDSAVIKLEVSKDYMAWQHDICASLRIDITPSWSVKAEIHQLVGASDVLAIENSDGIPKKLWQMGLVKTTYSF